MKIHLRRLYYGMPGMDNLGIIDFTAEEIPDGELTRVFHPDGRYTVAKRFGLRNGLPLYIGYSGTDMYVRIEMEDRIDITELSLGVVLAALYNNTRTSSLPLCQLQDIGEMTEKQAENFIDTNGHLMSDDNRRISFDHVHGRAIKADFFEDDDGKIWLEKVSLYNWESVEPANKVVGDLHHALRKLQAPG